MKLIEMTPDQIQNLIKRQELDIAEFEEERRKIEKRISQYRSSYVLAAVGFFVGIIIIVLGYWICGGVLFLAGALAAITQTIQINRLHHQEAEYDMQIKRARISLRSILVNSK